MLRSRPDTRAVRGAIPALVSCFGIAACLSAGPSGAVVLDDFEAGDLAVSVMYPDSDNVVSEQIGLPTANVLSGNRQVVLNLGGTMLGDSLSATLETGPGDDGIVLASATDDPLSFFDISYTFSSPVDLTGGGTLDRFRIEISSASSGVSGILAVRDTVNGVEFAALVLPGPGVFEIPFDAFRTPPDLTTVDAVSLAMLGLAPGTITISDFSIVPEPSTALLLVVGLLGIAGGRRRA